MVRLQVMKPRLRGRKFGLARDPNSTGLRQHLPDRIEGTAEIKDREARSEMET